jgi:hypothetical protein
MVMTEVVKAFVGALVQAGGEKRRAVLEGIVADARRSNLRDAAIRDEIESRRADALAKLWRVHADHFGNAPGPLDRFVTVLDARGLELAALLVADSTNGEDLASRLAVLGRARIEEYRRGAAGVLARLLEHWFGVPVGYDYDAVCRMADAHDLDGCFARLKSATSADEVLAPVLRRFEERVREQQGTTAW